MGTGKAARRNELAGNVQWLVCVGTSARLDLMGSIACLADFFDRRSTLPHRSPASAAFALHSVMKLVLEGCEIWDQAVGCLTASLGVKRCG